MSERDDGRPQSDVRTAIGRRHPTSPGRIERARDPRNALARLLPYLASFKVQMGVVFGFVILYTLLGLVGPYLMGRAIDDFITTKRAAGLLSIALLMLAAYVFNNAFQAAANWIMANVSQRALKGIRRDLFAQLQRLSMAYFDRNSAGELMSRLTNDIDAINQAVSQNVTSLVASLLTMVGILVTMFVLNAWLALVTVLVVPIMLGFTEFVARYTRKGFRSLQKDLGNLNSVMEESISGQRVIKAFRRSASVTAEFNRVNELVCQSGIYANTYALLLMPLTNVLGNFFVILLAGVGGWLALQGLVTVGLIATFISYGQNFVQPLRQLANMYNSVQGALAGAERVFEILDAEPEVEDSPHAFPLTSLQGQVRFDRVSFSYLADKPIIKDMSFEARPGQIIALVGPTGAGKTTLVNLLMRFYDIDVGEISIDGRDILSLPKADLRRRLGLVFQDTFLFSDSVMENIRYGRLEASDEEVMEAARMADADHFIRLLPNGYKTDLTERASNLSQGQRQMLSIARAILADPGILILDEATSSVDTRTETRIQAALLRLMHDRTSFVVAHRLSTIRDADNVVVIDEGRIIEQGTHQQLMDKHGFYAHLVEVQYKGHAI